MSSQPIVLRGGIVTNPTLQTQKVPPNGWSLDGLYFDAWLNLFHDSSLTITQHPVETGAAITDHAYVNPKRFSFQIGITDSFSAAAQGNFPAAPTRSINAYNQLLNRQENRLPMRLVCKYGSYDNILIESLQANDDYTTTNAGKFTVNLVEIIRADVRLVKVTLLPQTVNQTNRGQVNGGQLQSTLSRIVESLR